MSEVNNVHSTSGAQASAAHVEGKAAKSGYTTHTKISNMEQLKSEAPEVYKSMMQGLAQNMISKMRDQQEHLKKMMREGRERH